jgi:hypothetical protein
MFRQGLQSIAVDSEGKPIKRGRHLVTRGELIVDKCLTRAERGDMYAMKLIVDIVEPKQLRVAVEHAVTIEQKLNPILQAIVDRLSIDAPTPIQDTDTYSISKDAENGQK